jgi:riboflavin synthase
MFTGLIREIAKIKSFEGSKLSVYSKHNAKLGDSIAINGACLTVVEVGSGYFSVSFHLNQKIFLR